MGAAGADLRVAGSERREPARLEDAIRPVARLGGIGEGAEIRRVLDAGGGAVVPQRLEVALGVLRERGAERRLDREVRLEVEVARRCAA